MAAALPKSRRIPFRANKLPLVTGKNVVHDQLSKIFQKPVFMTDRLLAFKQKIIIDNILHAFYEENEAHLLQTLKALTEELYGFHTKDKNEQAENSAGTFKVIYLENPESAKILILALKESEWLIQSPVQKPAVVGGNGRLNQSISWMKAMAIAIIKDVVLRDYDSSILASGEKIMVTCYNHPPLENCDFFTAFMRKEVDCILATTIWLEKDENDEKYKNSYPFDSDLDNKEDNTAREWEYNGPNSSAGYEEDP
ncbi:hypothetical protein ACLB2K_008157 [Fragaria x ananassa]